MHHDNNIQLAKTLGMGLDPADPNEVSSRKPVLEVDESRPQELHAAESSCIFVGDVEERPSEFTHATSMNREGGNTSATQGMNIKVVNPTPDHNCPDALVHEISRRAKRRCILLISRPHS